MAPEVFDIRKLSELSVAQRLQLIELIARSLREAGPNASEQLTVEQRREMDRRMAAFRNDRSRAMSRAQFRKKLRGLK